MASPTTDRLGALIAAAREVQPRGYAPYSGFRVGAAVLGDSGRLHTGCNVENSSFGLTLCAERAAVATAVAAGERELLAVAIASSAPDPTPPCGACRQVLMELCIPDAIVIASGAGGERRWSLASLLPDAFSSAYLALPAERGD